MPRNSWQTYRRLFRVLAMPQVRGNKVFRDKALGGSGEVPLKPDSDFTSSHRRCVVRATYCLTSGGSSADPRSISRGLKLRSASPVQKPQSAILVAAARKNHSSTRRATGWPRGGDARVGRRGAAVALPDCAARR